LAKATAGTILRGALLGAGAGYLAAGVLASTAAGAWAEAMRRYVHAWQGGTGEASAWGEPVFYGLLLLILPGPWSLPSTAAGAAVASLAVREGRVRMVAASLTTALALAVAALVLWPRHPRRQDAAGLERSEMPRTSRTPFVDPRPPDWIPKVRERCEAGHGPSCNVLADLHRTGDGVERDTTRAAQLYRRACDLHATRSCFKLAGMYEQGEGVAFDAAQALSLYQQVCDAGDAAGCYAAGYWSLYGLRGQLRDDAAARRAFEKGCGLGNGPSCFLMGTMIERATRDFVSSAKLYEKACGLAHAPGCQYLGDFYMHGEGVAMDATRGQALYRQTAGMYDAQCKRGDGGACHALGFMYENGHGVASDHVQAVRLWNRACAAGSREGCEAAKRRGG
jgi:hypothetical protein